ncbi:MAG: HD domain-containing phosphohydrolase [Christensenellaceae bacterium]|jgi:response regulator RpfG family c-di-GMP phosphodiesterase
MHKNSILLAVGEKKEIIAQIHTLFDKEYGILETTSGDEALRLLEEHSDAIAAVLLGKLSSGKSSQEFLDYMRFNRLLGNIPVIFVSDDPSCIQEEKALASGASDYIRVPFNPNILKWRVKRMVELYDNSNNLKTVIADQTLRLENYSRYIMDALANILQHKKRQPQNSMLRINAYAKTLLSFLYHEGGYNYRLTEKNISIMSAAAIIRDIGELVLSDYIVNSPEEILSDRERRIFQLHTTRGYEIMLAIKDEENNIFFDYAADICRSHHERWNGSGFPDGLVGDEIPIGAQVASVAETYDNLRSGITGGEPHSHEKAVDIMENRYKGYYSPLLMECFKLLEDELDAVTIEYAD